MGYLNAKRAHFSFDDGTPHDSENEFQLNIKVKDEQYITFNRLIGMHVLDVREYVQPMKKGETKTWELSLELRDKNQKSAGCLFHAGHFKRCKGRGKLAHRSMGLLKGDFYKIITDLGLLTAAVVDVQRPTSVGILPPNSQPARMMYDQSYSAIQLIEHAEEVRFAARRCTKLPLGTRKQQAPYIVVHLNHTKDYMRTSVCDEQHGSCFLGFAW